MSYVCPYCNKSSFKTQHALDCHVSRERAKPPNKRCCTKEQKRELKRQYSELDKVEAMNTINQATKTHDLLEQMKTNMDKLNTEIFSRLHYGVMKYENHFHLYYF